MYEKTYNAGFSTNCGFWHVLGVLECIGKDEICKAVLDKEKVLHNQELCLFQF